MAAKRDFMIAPGGRLAGRIKVPGDKSISHRAIMLGALAEGATHVTNFLQAADCLATVSCLRKLGIKIEEVGAGHISVHGVGIHGLQAPEEQLDCGNSGTSLRLLTGLAAGQPFESVLSGDVSLRRRPMLRVIEPLTRMGARIDSMAGYAPLSVRGKQPLKSLRYEIPIASAQVKSSVLLAGLQADGETWITEPVKTRDHTELMLQSFGCSILHDGKWFGIQGNKVLKAANIVIPGDLSSAAFFLAGAASLPGARILVEGIGINPSRDGVLRLLQAMGAEVRFSNERMLGTEPVADVEVYGQGLRGLDIGPDTVPFVIDELPALLVAAASAHGTTTLRGAAELRVKESDRLQAMAAGLHSLGVEVELWEDGMRVIGRDSFQGGELDSCGDHRIAMSFAMAGLRSRSPVRIRNCSNVDTSFPGFAELAQSAGLPIEVMETPIQ
jgi:3-phosphoshikimate 1-carboxyvinyltransferase